MLPNFLGYSFRTGLLILVMTGLCLGLLLTCKFSSNKNYLVGDQFAIATDHPLASQAGKEAFQQGGNVVDAFVAASFAISVLRPQSTGLAGGGFALVHTRESGKTVGFDFRERAPGLARPRMYLGIDGKPIGRESLFGWKSVAVPGMVPGLLRIHAQYGKLSRKQVVQFAFRLADEGFTIYPDLESAIRNSEKEMNPAMRKIFLPKGKPLTAGSVLIQKDLAQVLSRIIQNGEEEFRTGETSQLILAGMAEHNGYLRASDLETYSVEEVEPIRLNYREYLLEGFPPPSSALFLYQILSLLEIENLQTMKKNNPNDFYRFLVEAMRYGYLNRSVYGGDPRFISIPATSLLSKDSIHRAYAETKKLPQSKQKATIPETMESYNTTHISVMDSQGNTVSSTHSINYIFGSRVVVEGTGLVLNDTMDDFSISPNIPNAYGLVGALANQIEAGKTPLSSMSPTIVWKEGKVFLSLGAPGGSYIPNAILQTLVNRLDFGLSPYESVASPRIHHQFQPDLVFWEQGLEDTASYLEGVGYETKFSQNRAKVFYVERGEDGRIHAVSDPRGQGIPAVK